MCAHQNGEINMSRKFHVTRYLHGLYKGVTPPGGSSLRSRRLEIVGARKNERTRGRHARGEGVCLSRARSFLGLLGRLREEGKQGWGSEENNTLTGLAKTPVRLSLTSRSQVGFRK